MAHAYYLALGVRTPRANDLIAELLAAVGLWFTGRRQEPSLCTCDGNIMSTTTVRRTENKSHVQGSAELKARSSRLPPPQTTARKKPTHCQFVPPPSPKRGHTGAAHWVAKKIMCHFRPKLKSPNSHKTQKTLICKRHCAHLPKFLASKLMLIFQSHCAIWCDVRPRQWNVLWTSSDLWVWYPPPPPQKKKK